MDALTTGAACAYSTSRLLCNYSVEITARDTSSLLEAAPYLPIGSRVSITFLPNEDFPARIKAARCVRELGFIPVPHLSARRFTSAHELEHFLSELASGTNGVDHCFIVAGDLDRPQGPYNDALSIIRSGLLEKYGVRNIGIAGYPEGHPKIDRPCLLQAMQDKHAAAEALGMRVSIVTQFGFNADPILNWLQELRQCGIQAEVYVGVPGPASARTLLRFATRCGVAASTQVIGKYGLSLANLLTTTGPDSIVSRLQQNLDSARHGEVFLHFYPFGGLPKTVEWVRHFADEGR